jgi:hypothetical protein
MGGMSFTPPFVISTAVSSTGVLASGLADGRLYVGFGGERQLMKRGKKWNGLEPSAEWIDKVAEGPIVAMYVFIFILSSSCAHKHYRQFSDPDTLVLSTMLGTVMGFQIHRGKTVAETGVTKTWELRASTLEKVNALLVEHKKLVLGGLAKDGKGVIEIYSHT